MKLLVEFHIDRGSDKAVGARVSTSLVRQLSVDNPIYQTPMLQSPYTQASGLSLIHPSLLLLYE